MPSPRRPCGVRPFCRVRVRGRFCRVRARPCGVRAPFCRVRARPCGVRAPFCRVRAPTPLVPGSLAYTHPGSATQVDRATQARFRLDSRLTMRRVTTSTPIRGDPVGIRSQPFRSTHLGTACQVSKSGVGGRGPTAGAGVAAGGRAVGDNPWSVLPRPPQGRGRQRTPAPSLWRATPLRAATAGSCPTGSRPRPAHRPVAPASRPAPPSVRSPAAPDRCSAAATSTSR